MSTLKHSNVHWSQTLPQRYDDRREAGRILAQHLQHYSGRSDVLVLALPRGGVPVAFEIAQVLGVPLDVFIVRKLGVPGYEELALGALASGGVRILNDDVVQNLQISSEEIEAVVADELQELERRQTLYRHDRPPLTVRDKTIVLVDDGVATGATLRAAIAALRLQSPRRIVVAIGVAPPESCDQIASEADELICPLRPDPFWSVGAWFADFAPTSDQTVIALLAQAAQ